MEVNQSHTPDQQSAAQSGSKSSNARRLLNLVIVALLIVVGYFLYGVFSRSTASQPPVDTVAKKQEKIIQLDVLNGCGAKGVAAKITNYLRVSGFDVVEMRNYKTSHIPRTLVVDRVGNLEAARRIAASLAVSERNVIQQINPDYFVDVSVIIGDDYQNLLPMR